MNKEQVVVVEEAEAVEVEVEEEVEFHGVLLVQRVLPRIHAQNDAFGHPSVRVREAAPRDEQFLLARSTRGTTLDN